MWKFIEALLGCVAIAIVSIIIFWPSIGSVTNTTVATINSTYPDSSNYTGLSNGIAFGPLLMWAVAFIAPLGLFALFVWYRRKS